MGAKYLHQQRTCLVCFILMCFVLWFTVVNITSFHNAEDRKIRNVTDKTKADANIKNLLQKDSIVDVKEKKDAMERFMTSHSQINRRRREQIIEKCTNYPELVRSIDVNTYRQIYVNENHKLLYCFIPKVGCTNLKKVMMILGGSTKKISEISDMMATNNNGLRQLASFSPFERHQKLRDYKKFVYVRNPFARVLSAFSNKFGDINVLRSSIYLQELAKKIMKEVRPHATARELGTGENITWTEFVQFLTKPNRPPFDIHWKEMHKLCSPCKITYDYIGHLETFGEDAKFMHSELQLDSKVEIPLKNNSYATNSTAKFEKAFKSLPRGYLQKMWRIYEKDFEIFGYPKPITET